MVNFFQETLSNLLSGMVTGHFEVSALKKFLASGSAQTAANATINPQQAAQGIRFGGVFSLADETAFNSLASKLNKDELLAITRTVNSLPDVWQRRKFRASVGALDVDFVKNKTTKKVEIIKKSGKTSATKKTDDSHEEISNVGVDFLKNLAKLTENERMEVIQASGVLDSVIDDFVEKNKEGWENFNKKLAGRKYRGFWRELISFRSPEEED